MQVELHFVGDGLVALAGEDVEHRLAADDLRSRRHQRRKAQVFTHPWNLGEYFVDAVQGALLFELVGQVGHHPARHLVDLHAGVHGGELAFKLVVLLAHGIEVQTDFLQQLQVQAGVVFAALERSNHRLGASVAGAPGKAGDRGVDMGRAVLDRLHLAHRGQACGVVAVDKDRQRLLGLQRLDQLAGGVRSQQTGHVLDRHRVTTHRFHLFGLVNEGLDRVHRAGGVAQGALGMFAGGFHGFDGHTQVTHVVHRVEDAEYVDAIHGGLGDKGAHHVIAVVAIAKQVLPAQEHLQTGVGQRRLEQAQALPRVFLEEAHTGVEGRAAPDFQRPVANLIELGADRQHVFGAHAGGDQRLVGVTQDGVGDKNLLAHVWVPLTGRRGRR